MTPAQHATEAAASLTRAKTPVRNGVPHARIAVVHAVLSKKAGTGTDYTTAEQLLLDGEAAPRTDAIDQALAHAHLAP
ncbi:UNVERIFIED_ORG: hypothetical protein E4P37_03430 [Bacillus sp. AZ43]